ncbi:MAG TPA: SURF1 family protein [Rhizomicrobium sp.]|jgi:surfeit locus 1 family protein|nr:SURF1 family protein [Rhizomicrobium sp.]
MRIAFRPLLVPSLVSAVLFAALMALGVWQVERLSWKRDLIATVSSRIAAAPVTLNQALALGADAQYRRVRLAGRFDNAKEAYVFGTGVEGAPVFHVIVPFTSDDGRVVLVDRGIVPRDLMARSTRSRGLIEGRTVAVGIWRAPDQAGTFTPKPDLARRIWYSHDVAGIARADGVRLAAPVIVEADSTPNPGGWPKGGQTRVNFRNEHLQYAITWFLLAAGLLAVYFAYHVSRGRLTLSSKDQV